MDGEGMCGQQHSGAGLECFDRRAVQPFSMYSNEYAGCCVGAHKWSRSVFVTVQRCH